MFYDYFQNYEKLMIEYDFAKYIERLIVWHNPRKAYKKLTLIRKRNGLYVQAGFETLNSKRNCFSYELFKHTYTFSAVSVSPVAANVLSTSTCLSSPFPIRPIVAHPSQPPTGSLSLLPPFYMPAAMYSHQGKSFKAGVLKLHTSIFLIYFGVLKLYSGNQIWKFMRRYFSKFSGRFSSKYS